MVCGAQAYVDNLKATGQCEDGCIIGLDGTAWTGGLAVTAEEGAAIVAGFDDSSGLRASGIMVAGKKFMYLRNDEEMMCGKQGQGGICIFKTGQACIMGTYNQDMSPANNTKEVGKMAVRNQPSVRILQFAPPVSSLCLFLPSPHRCSADPRGSRVCACGLVGLPEGGRLLSGPAGY